MLTKHRTILHYWTTSMGLTSFLTRDEDTGSVVEAHELPEDVWVDMGSPDTITVTVEPGDLLNESE